MTIYSWLVIACWGIFIAVWSVAALRAKKNVGKSRGLQHTVFRILAAVAVLALLRVHAFDQLPQQLHATPAGHARNTAAVALCALGIALAIWARIHIGSNWGVPMSVKENPELITGGPYARLRHPIYTGIMMAVVGSTLLGAGLWLFIPLVMGGYFHYSAKKEEALMLRLFPQEYPGYMERTAMLVPFVY